MLFSSIVHFYNKPPRTVVNLTESCHFFTNLSYVPQILYDILGKNSDFIK